MATDPRTLAQWSAGTVPGQVSSMQRPTVRPADDPILQAILPALVRAMQVASHTLSPIRQDLQNNDVLHLLAPGISDRIKAWKQGNGAGQSGLAAAANPWPGQPQIGMAVPAGGPSPLLESSVLREIWDRATRGAEMGKRGQIWNAIQDDLGNVHWGQSWEHHGDTLARLEDAGVPVTNPNRVGWAVVGGGNPRGTFIGLQDLDPHEGDFARAYDAKYGAAADATRTP